MTFRSSRHQAVLEELTEWWEDVRDRGIGSRVVLMQAPQGWGVSAVLGEFRELAENPDPPVTITIGIDRVPLVNRAIQAAALRDALMTPFVRARAAELLDLDTAAGRAQLGLGVGGLFASSLAAAVPLLIGSMALTAAGNAWDASPGGQQGAVAKAARAVAAISVITPVTVIVDDADQLDLDLALAMIENLASRYDGQVLVVVGVAPGSPVAAGLFDQHRYGLLGRVQRADADLAMDYPARVALAREIAGSLTAPALERIARRTHNFGEVFAVAAAEWLADEDGLDAVDAVINAALAPASVTAQATMLGWAGGTVTTRQADRALKVLDSAEPPDDPWVTRAEGLARLTDPASSRVAEHVVTLGRRTRRRLATVMLEEAIAIAADAGATLTERVVARLVAHRVRDDLDRRDGLTGVQCLLIRGLERLGDPAAAREIATVALAELPGDHPERAEFLKAILRLALPGQDEEPMIKEAVSLALADGAVLGLEARVWAAANLLSRPGPHDSGLILADQVAAELAGLSSRDPTANQWRTLLAFRAGRAGYPTLSQRLLAPVIGGGTMTQQQAAHAVLRAVGGPAADTRLQVIILETELAATHQGADDSLLRLHTTLARDYDTLGDYRSALRHGADQLELSLRIFGPDHAHTLQARRWCASWTGHCGDSARALRLFRELLPDQIRVLGPDHPHVLVTRNNIAAWTGENGDTAEALRLFRELLPDRIRVLGPDHPDVLLTRNNVATWMDESGDPEGAVQWYRDLLPDRIRLLGRDHPDVLLTRNNLMIAIGKTGAAAEALRLARELVLDEMRVLGVDHPYTLKLRDSIAFLTASCGDNAEALRLFWELLPDVTRALGPDHPDVLTLRHHIAEATADCGDVEGALQLAKNLLVDQVRILGPDHPNALMTRRHIAEWRHLPL